MLGLVAWLCAATTASLLHDQHAHAAENADATADTTDATGTPDATDPPDPAQLEARIAQLIGDLADDDFMVREEATEALWRLGPVAEAAVREASRSSDAEVAQRAGLVYERFQYGIFHDLPEAVIELLENYRRSDTRARQQIISQLQHREDVPVQTIARLAEAETHDSLRRALNSLMERTILAQVPKLIADGRIGEARMMILPVAMAGNRQAADNVLALDVAAGELDTTLAHLRAAPASAATQRLLARYHRAAGDMDGALKVVAEADDPMLHLGLLIETGRWQQAADFIVEQPTLAREPWCMAMHVALLHLSGATDAARLAMEQIQQQTSDRPRPTVPPRTLLLLTDHFEQGLAHAIEEKQFNVAGTLMAAMHRYEELLALTESATDPTDDEHRPMLRIRLGVLAEMGQMQEARQLAMTLVESYTGSQGQATVQWLRTAADMFEAGLDEAAHALLERMDDDLLLRAGVDQPKVRLITAGDLGWPDSNHAAWWLQIAQQLEPQDTSFASQVRRLRGLAHRSWQREEFTALLKRLEDMLQANGSVEDETHLKLARFCEHAGFHDLALPRYLAHALSANLPDAWLRFVAAARRAGEVERMQRELLRVVPDSTVPMRYLAIWAQLQTPDRTQALVDLERLSLSIMGNADQRLQLIDIMQRLGERDQADQQQRILLLSGDYLSFPVGQTLRSRGYTRPHAVASPRAQRIVDAQRSRLELLQPHVLLLDQAGHVHMATFILRLRSDHALSEGDYEQAYELGRTSLRIAPGDVAVVLQLHPKLTDAGQHDLAKQLYGQQRDHFEKLVKRFPRAARQHNAYAWVMARCHRDLDRALVIAQRAVELEPRNAAYIDTLAEVHFVSGRQDKALELIEQCIALEPDRGFFQRQRERFRRGDIHVPPGQE